jgi:hypothetical protein
MAGKRANLGGSVHLLENRRVQCLWHLRAWGVKAHALGSAAKLESQGMAVCQ